MGANLKLQGDILEWMDSVVQKADKGQAFLNRVVYPLYQNIQRERWETQNWGKWPRLNPKYEAYKRTKYSKFPGGGSKMMVATYTLAPSVTGDKKQFHRKIVTQRKLVVGTTVPYAKYADDKREFSEMPDKFWDKVGDEYVKYLIKGGT